MYSWESNIDIQFLFLQKKYWYTVWFEVQQDLFVFILTNCVSLREGKKHGSSTNSPVGGSKKHGGNKNDASHFKSKSWYAKITRNEDEAKITIGTSNWIREQAKITYMHKWIKEQANQP